MFAETRPAGAADAAEGLLDELLPASLDWRHLVRKYPQASLAVAAGIGFWLGSRKSDLVLTAVGGYLATQLGDSIDALGILGRG